LVLRQCGLVRSPVGLTQEAQHRLQREYRSTKVARRKLPDGALSVRDAWVGCKTRRLRNRVFRTMMNLSGFLLHPNLNRGSPTGMNYMTYRDEKRESSRIESGLGRQVKAALRIS
jgi:hypothetical protein